MVRTFILNEDQREAIEDYLKRRPSAMSAQIRQIRLRSRELDYDQMQEDMELLKRLGELRIPKGRKSVDMMASFTIQAKQESEIPAKFTVSPYGQVLKEFMESGEQLSVISPLEERDPKYIRQRLARLSERAGYPILASVRNDEVYLERTDKTEEKT